jgi:hypothetical protein
MPLKSSDRMVEALRLIKEEARTPYMAAKLTGLCLSTVVRSKLYRDWLESKGTK